jgi:hypothetical protein
MRARCIVAAALALAACCPFPWKRTALIRPGGTVRVLDAESGEPIEGARVVLRRCRVGPPPHVETHRWEADTDGKGEASFEIELEKETVFPLMMHGVPQWGFEVCVTAKDHAGRAEGWLVVSPQADRRVEGTIGEALEVRLDRGEGGCPWIELEGSAE